MRGVVAFTGGAVTLDDLVPEPSIDRIPVPRAEGAVC
jgi:hypothetical protein